MILNQLRAAGCRTYERDAEGGVPYERDDVGIVPYEDLCILLLNPF